ncbi:hypothetical protein RIF29_29690 [Crotalaria pallida]|uniref:Uncharacterized protein n=1 Tax=Crotalaria pallida TaxID=3830 RepID=A0AAN9EFC1_CROPI
MNRLSCIAGRTRSKSISPLFRSSHPLQTPSFSTVSKESGSSRKRKGRVFEDQPDFILLGEESISERQVASSVSKERLKKSKKGRESEPDFICLGEGLGSSHCAVEKMVSDSSSSFLYGRKRNDMKGKRVVEPEPKPEPDFVILDKEDGEGCEWDFSFGCGSKGMWGMLEEESQPVEVIEIDDDDDDDVNGDKGIEDSDEKERHERGKGVNAFVDKGKNFVDLGCDFGPERCDSLDLVADSGGEEEEDGGGESDSGFDSDYISSSTEYDDSSDEDYQVHKEKQISTSEDDSTSCDDSDSDEGEKQKGRNRKSDHQSASLQKETRDSAEIIKSRENEKKEKGDEKAIYEKYATDCMNIDDDNGKDHPDKGTEVTSNSTLLKNQGKNDANDSVNIVVDDDKGKYHHPSEASGVASPLTVLKNEEKKGDSVEIRVEREGNEDCANGDECLGGMEKEVDDVHCQPACGHGGLSSKRFWDKAEEPVQKSEAEKELDMLWEKMDFEPRSEGSSVGNIKADEAEQNRGSPTNLSKHDKSVGIGKDHPSKGTGAKSASTSLKNQEKRGDSAKIWKERAENKYCKKTDVNSSHCLSGMEVKVDEVNQRDSQPPACGQGGLPSKCFQEKAKEPVKKSEVKGELNMLREEMNCDLRFEEIGSSVGNIKTDEAEQSRGSPTNLSKHDKSVGIGKYHPSKGTGVTSASTSLKNQEKRGDSAKIRKERAENKYCKKTDVNSSHCLSGMEVKVDEVNQRDSQPPACGQGGLPSKCFQEKAKEPVKKSEVKGELNMLREEMNCDLRFEEIGSSVGNKLTNEAEQTRGSACNLSKDDKHHGKYIDKGKNHSIKGTGVISASTPSRPKEMHLIEMLVECFGKKHNAIKADSNGLVIKDYDVRCRDTQPPAGGHGGIPLKFFWEKPEEPVEKSEEEKELDRLWQELDFLHRSEEMDSMVGNPGTDEAEQNRGSPASRCKHELILDEEIGIVCRYCLWISLDIKHVFPSFANEDELPRSRRKTLSDGVNDSLFGGAEFNVSVDGDEAVWSHTEGTIWDLIPDVKRSFYPHQREGFEFIWTNLAGTIDLQKLKNADPSRAGGCIISHAPGTGKTRLTIVFLQTFLKVFPQSRAIIIAPASLLLTWEDEFRKWKIGIPFHNLNNLDASGKEHVDATSKVEWCRSSKPNKSGIRMVKLYSWFKEKSILGLSYHLYEKLAGGESNADVKTAKQKRKMKMQDPESRVMGKFLREVPDLFVLDEGHTPRNQTSRIWQVLSEVQTQKRIILSGTPFQNNFLELYNTFCLAKPNFPDTIPPELKKFCQSRLIQEKKVPKGLSWGAVSPGNTTGDPSEEKIKQLKLLMDPFVHVHKGSILQKNLFGLRECVVTLKPKNLQKALLENIECSQCTFGFDHKLALVSIHPSLFLNCPLLEKEDSVVDKVQLEELKLNPYEGVKTRFLVEFVRLCDALQEKVLVFSEYIDPLCLLIKQFESVFNWSEGKEVLYMHGKLNQKQRQSLIHSFNDANSKAKIFLASSNACSEGINLVGASRVVLLNVLWNPSKERQAISRAYRIGQKKAVYTYHLITEESWAKFCKSQKKDWYSEKLFSDQQESSAVVLEDKVLDQMVHHDKLKDMFGDCIIQRKETDFAEN